MASSESEKQVKNLTDDLPSLATNMQLFSLAMRSLYAEECVSSSVEHGEEFVTLRDETRDDAIAYLKGVMPLNETCIIKLQEFFEYYESLEFDEWKECVDDILQEVMSYQEMCNALIKIHEQMMVPLKQREDKAKILVKKFKDLNEKYEKEVAALRKKADAKMGWGLALALIPGVNVIATPILCSSAEDDLATAVAKMGQKEIMFHASKAVSETLIPALAHFVEGLEIVAGFFNIMHKELKSFERMDSKKKMHYMVLKKKATEVKAGCRAFHAVLPAVRSNFQAIPENGSNKNYVDEWLEKQREIIHKNCKAKMTLKFLHKALNSA